MTKTLLWALFPLLFASCGYHLGGLKKKSLDGMETCRVEMFANHTTQPQVSRLLTTSLANALQKDGTFRLASSPDFTIGGTVTQVRRSVLTTDTLDTYRSSEIGLTVVVNYTLTDNRTGKAIGRGTAQGMAGYFNNNDSNMQTARENAISYAARLAADSIVRDLTLP